MKLTYEIKFAGFATTTVNCRHIEQFLHVIADKVGGATISDHLGAYVMQDGELVKEKSFTIATTILLDNLSEQYWDSFIEGIAEQIKFTFNQEAVLLTKTKHDEAKLIF